MKKIISFSLYGNKPMYTIGAIKNADLAKIIYPDWICLYYIFDCVPKNIIDELRKKENVELKIFNHKMENDSRGMFYRFFPLASKEYDYVICRDTDSRLSYREKYAVDEWISSGKSFHIMRDHPYHKSLIQGGLWGSKCGIIENLLEKINTFSPSKEKGQDERFLEKEIWPHIKDNCTIHDEFWFKCPYPTACKRGKENNGVYFLGQVFDENDKFNDDDLRYFK